MSSSAILHPLYARDALDDRAPAKERWLGVTIVAALHAAALAAVASYAPAREALGEALPIMVSLVQPEAPAVVRTAPPAPIIPRHVVPPLRQAPVITARAASSSATSEAPIAPAPVMTAPPAPVPAVLAPSAPVVMAPAPIVAPAPPPAVIPPRYDAAYLDNPAPTYPALSRRLREQGRVVLRVLVSIGGTPERVELRASSGSERLDHSAEDTVRRWRFVPARQGSDVVPAWVLVPIAFNLEG
jgi:protein TonB